MVPTADVRIARPRHQCANPSNGLPPHSLPAVRRLLTSPQRVLFVERLPFTLSSPFSVALSLPDENGAAGTSSSGIYRDVSRCTHE